MDCATKTIHRRCVVAKKHTTKYERVNYFEVPKPLWKRVKHLFPKPPKKRGKGRPPWPIQWVLNAIWYVMWTGCQWKALPEALFGVMKLTQAKYHLDSIRKFIAARRITPM